MRNRDASSALVRVNQNRLPSPRTGRAALADMRELVAEGGASVNTEQMAGLDRDWLVPGMSRWTSPELSAADYSEVDPSIYHELAAYQVPPFVPLLGVYEIVRADYNIVGSYEHLRAGLSVVEALGRNEQASYSGYKNTTAGTISFQGFSAPNIIAGFQIDWGVPELYAQPLEIGIDTYYFKDAFGWGTVDRSLTLRVNDLRGGASGGKFQVLFSHRQTTAQTCGVGTAGVYAGGMQMAIFQPAVVPCSLVMGTGDPERFPPLYISDGDADSLPRITLTVPTSLITNFDARCRLLTAASPQVALLRDRLVLNGASSRWPSSGGQAPNGTGT